MTGVGLLSILALGLAAAVQASPAPAPAPRPLPAQALGGQRIAQRNCGICHAVDARPSPLADAPPFATLYRRYPPGGLDQILTEGMLAPSRKPEEGSPDHHPRMPMVALDDDEVSQLKAYLRSLDPRPGASTEPR
uniref:Cytochrome c class I n=1 Tax=Caulobacter sp. (strain K31) TaxID=366602 RepID=B0SVX1_CAUSK